MLLVKFPHNAMHILPYISADFTVKGILRGKNRRTLPVDGLFADFFLILKHGIAREYDTNQTASSF